MKKGAQHTMRADPLPLATAVSSEALSPRERIDWSQLWYPGPRRVFTEAELARAGGDRPSRTFLVMMSITFAMLAEGVLQRAPEGEVARLTGLMVAFAFATYRGAMWLWRNPTRWRLLMATVTSWVLMSLFLAGLFWRMDKGPALDWFFFTTMGSVWLSNIGFWFVAVYRSQQVDARLRELDERDRAIALARQLATAQIQPHFLFNSLASLQHWVDTRDERAGPMLASLTGYLRATLPLFDRPELTLGEELEAARRYLEVMQARLGARLRWEIDAEPAALTAVLPPGVLLTLVENAVEHGVSPQLSGGVVRITARVQVGDLLQVDVADDGPGLRGELSAEGAAAGPGQVGLANTRARLAQAFGPRASLALSNAAEGGCVARIVLPIGLGATPTTTATTAATVIVHPTAP